VADTPAAVAAVAAAVAAAAVAAVAAAMVAVAAVAAVLAQPGLWGDVGCGCPKQLVEGRGGWWGVEGGEGLSACAFCSCLDVISSSCHTVWPCGAHSCFAVGTCTVAATAVVVLDAVCFRSSCTAGVCLSSTLAALWQQWELLSLQLQVARLFVLLSGLSGK
jgi:hypothetical protein